MAKPQATRRQKNIFRLMSEKQMLIKDKVKLKKK